MLLLDTHALFRLDGGAPMAQGSIDAIDRAAGFGGDPADRLLVATARALPATLVTRDGAILSYAAAGHLDAAAC